VTIDGRLTPPTPEGFAAALDDEAERLGIAGTGGDPVRWLNALRPLLLIDTFEEVVDLTSYLRRDVLPALDLAVKVVVSGRQPLGDAWTRGLRGITVRSLPLAGFTRAEVRAYLALRGIETPDVVGDVLATSGGHPLAVTLASDLVEQFDLHRFRPHRDWQLAVRALVEALLRDIDDPDLLTLLDGCAVVRVFDEDALAFLSEREDIAVAFARLCRLSVVRATDGGLTLHDSVRRLLAQDLRWRRPDRFAELRVRAAELHRARSRHASTAQRERLLAEQLYLCQDTIVQETLFGEPELGRVWVAPVAPDEHEEVLALERRWMCELLPALEPELGDAPWNLEGHLGWVGQLLELPGRRASIARSDSGEAVGFDLIVPVCQESLPLLIEHETLGPLMRAHLAGRQDPLPLTASETDVWCFGQVTHSDVLAGETYSALLRDILSTLARGGLYLGGLHRPSHHALVSALGFRPVPGAEGHFRGQRSRGFELDLRAIGVEPWLHALITGRRPPTFEPGELERELREVLLAWTDDDRLARSPLLAFTPAHRDATAESLRSTVRRALEIAQGQASQEDRLSLEAVRLAYLVDAPRRERAAEQLAVSRATFYRLLRLGIGQLGAALPHAM
jgi:hypothetical protein